MTHVLSLVHGLAAGLISLALFHVAGLVLFPQGWRPGSSPAIVGVAFYMAACWTAVTQRDMPLMHVIPLFAGTCIAIGMVRGRWLGPALKAGLADPSGRQRVLAFCVFYCLTYLLMMPPAGDAFLPLAPERNVELVTHARYARHSLELGTPDDLDLAPFAYRRSPATSYLLAFQSMFFGRDPLTAAMPTLFAVVAVFGLTTMELLRRIRAPQRASIVIACVILSSPPVRAVIAGYGLPELIGATVTLISISAMVALTRPGTRAPAAAAIVAACLVFLFAEPVSREWIIATGRASGGISMNVSPLTLLGWPSRVSQVRSEDAIIATPLLLPITALIWTAAAYAARRSALLERLVTSVTDRDLARPLPLYVLAAVIIGNVSLAVAGSGSARVTAAWRGMEELNRLPFDGLTLKMSDRLDSLSTAIALYYLPAKRATVIGSDVNDEELNFDGTSRQTPIFIHNFGCPGAGHEDTVSVGTVGCLLLSPPTATLGTHYPFSRRFLFMSYEGMSARTPEGRFNTRSSLPLRVTADPQRARLDRSVHLNLLVNPQTTPAAKPQRLVFTWGNDRGGEVSIAQRAWLSVPLDTADWSGNRLWTVVVNIDFPDGRPMLFQELSLTETPQGQRVDGARAH